MFGKNAVWGKPFNIEVLFEGASLLFSLTLGVLFFVPHLLEFRTVHSLLSGFESIPEDNFLDSLCFPTRSKFNILSFDKHTSCFSSSKFLTELDSSFSNNLKDLCCYYTKWMITFSVYGKLLLWLEIPDPFPLSALLWHFVWLTPNTRFPSSQHSALLPCFDKFQRWLCSTKLLFKLVW